MGGEVRGAWEKGYYHLEGGVGRHEMLLMMAYWKLWWGKSSAGEACFEDDSGLGGRLEVKQTQQAGGRGWLIWRYKNGKGNCKDLKSGQHKTKVVDVRSQVHSWTRTENVKSPNGTLLKFKIPPCWSGVLVSGYTLVTSRLSDIRLWDSVPPSSPKSHLSQDHLLP